jgi:hypothetical protein
MPTTEKSIAALRHLIRFINVAKEYIVTLFDPLEPGLGRSTSTPECVRASNAVLGSFGLGQSASRQQYGDFGQDPATAPYAKHLVHPAEPRWALIPPFAIQSALDAEGHCQPG